MAGREPLPGTTDSTGAPDRLAPRVSLAVIAVVFTGLCVIATINVIETRPVLLGLAECVPVMAALLSLQLLHFTPLAARLRSRLGRVVLLLQAALVYTPFLWFGQAWVGMPGFLAGNTLLILSAPYSWAAFAAVVGSTGVLQASLDPRPLYVAYTTVSCMLTGLIVYGLSRLTGLVAEVHRSRLELAQLAVTQERLRFSRDLHDLLGYSLSAITLKSELTRRLVPGDPDRAQDELVEILEISRQALADVRSVASGYRDLSLDHESHSARSVLTAADIEVTLSIDHGPLPDTVNTVLATVLREGVTNVLGHSKAEHCGIIVDERDDGVRIRITNDGVRPAPEGLPTRRGTGLQSLSSRTAALGGQLSAGVQPDGRFLLEVTIPLLPPAAPAAPPDGRR